MRFNIDNKYKTMCMRSSELQSLWSHPSEGDIIVSRCSYCYDYPNCSDESPCNDCIEMDNVWIISDKFDYSESVGGTHWFFGAGLCSRDGGCLANETRSFVITKDGKTAEFSKFNALSISDFSWIPSQKQLQQIIFSHTYEARHILNTLLNYVNIINLDDMDNNIEIICLKYLMRNRYSKKWNNITNTWEIIE